MSADILIVEDDDTLRTTLADNLQDEGYRVRTAESAAAARQALAARTPDLVLLDIMLPDDDGYVLCRELRRDGFAGMILMLTARTLEDDLVRGFEAGCDDYVKKPYRLAELLVRVRALLRRKGLGRADDDGLPLLDGHRIDTEAHRVLDGAGEELKLTRTEYDLLLFLVNSRGRALTRDEILDEVWGKDIVVDARTVDNFVSSLKRKLSWTPASSFRIQTIRGVGYRFELGD